MYKTLKIIAKTIIPQKLLFENELLLRNLMYPIYKGNSHQCNICKSNLKEFVIVKNGNLVCPICGSLPRTRRLWKILNEEFLRSNIKLLDFSPSRAIYRKLKKNKSISYFPTDFENEFLADFRFDITKIDAPSENFDLILCYHILEHIEQDTKAMDELYRVLKFNGNCLIQTPFKEGDMYEDLTIKSPEERLMHFGQKDHVRIYSLEGLKQRLEKSGFLIKINTYPKDNYYGLSENEIVLFCTKIKY